VPIFRIGTANASLSTARKNDERPGTEGLPPRPCSSEIVARFRDPRAIPVALGLSTPTEPPLPISRRSPLLKPPFTASLPSPGGMLFFMNCKLQIADCKLQIEEIRMGETNNPRLCLSICNPQFEILQSNHGRTGMAFDVVTSAKAMIRLSPPSFFAFGTSSQFSICASAARNSTPPSASLASVIPLRGSPGSPTIRWAV